MRFGKTLEEKRKELRELVLNSPYQKKVFAFLPVELKDGSFAWLEFVNKVSSYYYNGSSYVRFEEWKD